MSEVDVFLSLILSIGIITIVIMGAFYIMFVPSVIGWIMFSKITVGCIITLFGISVYKNRT